MADYSTTAQLRNNCQNLTTAVISDVQVLTRIAMADNTIETDLSKVADFTLMPVTIIDTINLLSQYKTAELSLVYAYSAKRLKDSESDINYWKKLYDDLIAKILAGEISLGVIAKTIFAYSNESRDGVTPALGLGERGEYANDETVKAFRDSYGGDTEN
jgi:hypothetical protein